MSELLLEPYVDYRPGRVPEHAPDRDGKQHPYADSIDAAKRWLGDRYLCHEPINKRGRTK